MFIFKITSPMNSYDGSFFKYDKTFASDLYLIYKLSPSARVCISDTDRLLMFYLVLKIAQQTQYTECMKVMKLKERDLLKSS